MAFVLLDKILLALIMTRVLLLAALLDLNDGAVLLAHFKVTRFANVARFICAFCIALSQIGGDTGQTLVD